MNIPEGKYLGTLCQNGHNYEDTGKSLRYNDGKCCKCISIKKRKIYLIKKDNLIYKEQRRLYYHNRREHLNNYSKLRYQNNKEQLLNYGKEYRQKNKDKLKQVYRIRNSRRRIILCNRLSGIISNSIYHSLKKNKNGRHWETMVGYTLNELKLHIESLWQPEMMWNNYSRKGWHIDHIIPISAFNFDSPEHLDFKRCWSLSNLQPMWSKENLSKGNKINKSFQPCLKL